MERIITILSSGMGLGVYVPSLILAKNLRRRGIKSEIVVIESLFKDESKSKLLKNKRAFHDSFKVAVMGHKIPQKNAGRNFDMEKVARLFDYWDKENRKDFLMMSGHWYELLKYYMCDHAAKPLAVHLDAGTAPSWRMFQNGGDFDELWIFDGKAVAIPCTINVSYDAPAPYSERNGRFLVHGGGWGMGTYRDKIKELNDVGFDLDVVAYQNNETAVDGGNRSFLMDPNWEPWQTADESYVFPPMYENCGGVLKRCADSDGHQFIFDVVRKESAIISKPGGGTLLDSLSAATPVIFLEPVAEHERENCILWEKLGFGTTYEYWKNAGFSLAPLERMHKRLLDMREKTPDFLDSYLLPAYA